MTDGSVVTDGTVVTDVTVRWRLHGGTVLMRQ